MTEIDHKHPRQQVSINAGRGQAEEAAETPKTAGSIQGRPGITGDAAEDDVRQIADGFEGGIALRVTPAVTRLTVYRRPQVMRRGMKSCPMKQAYLWHGGASNMKCSGSARQN